MPFRTEWVDPDIALEHKGVTLWHIYKDDDIEQGARVYTFALDPAEDGYEVGGIDVQALPNWTEPPHPPYMGTDGDNSPENKEAWRRYHAGRIEDKHILAALKEAIDQGVLTQEGIKEAGTPQPPTEGGSRAPGPVFPAEEVAE